MSQSHKILTRIKLPTLITYSEGDKLSRYDFIKRIKKKYQKKEMILLKTKDYELELSANQKNNFILNHLKLFSEELFK